MSNDSEKHNIGPAAPSATTNGVESAQRKYDEEREKRIRRDGMAQYMDLYAHDKFRHFQADPWVQFDPAQSGLNPPEDGPRCEILIIGAGYGGLLFAVLLLQAGFRLEDIRMVDSAGGFGGTWYWN
ncbi:hypothetical protein FSST1_010146 [Fusarium sambucinum]